MQDNASPPTVRHALLHADLPPIRSAKPLFSIVIPARNATATLAQTLRSVFGQSLTDWELIVVDDGSTDDTAQLAKAVAGASQRLRVLSGPGRGVSAARNLGIAAARGTFLAFLDADDQWMPEKLQTHYEHFQARPDLGMSFDRVQFVDAHGRPTGARSTRLVQGLQPHDYLYGNPASTASTLVARRDVLELVGGFDEDMRFAEDLEIMIRMRCRSLWAVEGLPEVLTSYRTSVTGASAKVLSMHRGWEQLAAKTRSYAPAMIDQHYWHARAAHLRYLSRHCARLGLPMSLGLSLWTRAMASSPREMLRHPVRSLGAVACLLASRQEPTPAHY